jgi:hypothetical protein
MATSNETRVRVDGLSKIMASVRRSSGRVWSGAACAGDLRRLYQGAERLGIVIHDVGK